MSCRLGAPVSRSLSVIIPVYNRPAELDRALASLTVQTRMPGEVIIVDDGSPIDLLPVVGRYNSKLNLRFLRTENFGGPGRPRNVGARAASGEWLSFLDCDDWWYPGRIAAVEASMDGEVGAYYHRLECVREDSSGAVGKHFVGQAFSGELWRQVLTRGNPVPNSSAVVRKDIYLAVGGMSEERRMISVEDVDCWIKLSKLGVVFRFIDSTLGAYWVGTDGISRTARRQLVAQRALYRSHGRVLTGRLARDARSFHAYVMGTHCARSGRYRRRARAYFRIAAAGMPSLIRAKALIKYLQTVARIS